MTPDMQEIVDEMIASGRFATAKEVVVAALAHFRAWPTIQDLGPAFEEAIAECERDECTPLDFDEIKRKGRERVKAKQHENMRGRID